MTVVLKMLKVASQSSDLRQNVSRSNGSVGQLSFGKIAFGEMALSHTNRKSIKVAQLFSPTKKPKKERPMWLNLLVNLPSKKDFYFKICKISTKIQFSFGLRKEVN